MRFMASHEPFSAPWVSTASKAYCEQLGVKRHAGGKRGERNNLYPHIPIFIVVTHGD